MFSTISTMFFDLMQFDWFTRSKIRFLLLLLVPWMVANAVPVLLRYVPYLGMPIHTRLFGKNKTRRWFLGAVLFGTLTMMVLFLTWIISQSSFFVYLYGESFGSLWDIVGLGIVVSASAILWDLIESFIKRRRNIASWDAFVPRDQIDYIIWIILWTTLYYEWTGVDMLFVLLVWWLMSFFAHFSSYLMCIIDTKK